MIKFFGDPPSYFDLRDSNWVTSVKNQGACGSCWAHAAMSSLESVWLKSGNGEFNLSEQNLKNCHGFVSGPCEGGNNQKVFAYLTRIDGPILEIEDPYNIYDGNCNESFQPQTIITKALLLPNRTNAGYENILKWYLYNVGAIHTDMRWDNASYNSAYYTYYYNGSDIVSHAVTLVGWDDNYYVPGAPGNGAWIIKNSWGTGWGANGYFYISYYDTKVHSECGICPEKIFYDNNDVLHFYNKLGSTSSTGYSSNIGYGLIKFTANTFEQITHLCTWMKRPGTVSFYVYDNFSNGILSNLLFSLIDQTVEYSGYFSFPLVDPINISAENDFYIKVQYNTPGYNYPIPTEKAIENYAYPDIETGKCWISSSGISWTAVGNETTRLYDLCIRAYAKVMDSTEEITITFPANGSLNQSLNFEFSWNPVVGAQEYDFQLSYQPDFSTLISSDTISNPVYFIQGLNTSTTYYWRVRGSNGINTTEWSSIWNFSTYQELLPTTLISPSNNSIINPNNILLNWSYVVNSTKYHLQISDNSNFDTLLYNLTDITNNQISLSLPYNSLLFWRVRAINDYTSSEWSEIWNFTTEPSGLIPVPVNWNYESNSGNNAIIVILENINPFIINRYILYGDAIGLFFTRNDSLICAGYSIWNGSNLGIMVWGDDEMTENKDGFYANEVYTFKIWDAFAGREYIANATFSIGNDFYTVDGFTVLSSLNASTTFELNLNSGWNMISSYVIPTNPELEEMFDEVSGNVRIMKQGNGMFVPEWNINTIGDWNYKKGYQLSMYNEDILPIQGVIADPQFEAIEMNSGWNTIGYLRNSEMNIENAFVSINDNINLAKNNIGGIYSPAFGINTLGNMLPGEGYFVYMSNSDILTYPANSALKSVLNSNITPLAKQLIPQFKNTGNSSTLLLELLEIENGNEIGVYNVNDELIGSGAVHNGVAAITIWGDDEVTNEIDGAIENELLTVKLLNNNTLQNVSLCNINEITNNLEQDNILYRTNAIYIAKASFQSETELSFSISNIPNPVSNITTFEFSLINEAEAGIEIYTLTGELVAKIENSSYTAGMHKVNFDASNLASGVYNVVLRSGNQRAMTMMVIEK